MEKTSTEWFLYASSCKIHCIFSCSFIGLFLDLGHFGTELIALEGLLDLRHQAAREFKARIIVRIADMVKYLNLIDFGFSIFKLILLL